MEKTTQKKGSTKQHKIKANKNRVILTYQKKWIIESSKREKKSDSISESLRILANSTKTFCAQQIKIQSFVHKICQCYARNFPRIQSHAIVGIIVKINILKRDALRCIINTKAQSPLRHTKFHSHFVPVHDTVPIHGLCFIQWIFHRIAGHDQHFRGVIFVFVVWVMESGLSVLFLRGINSDRDYALIHQR